MALQTRTCRYCPAPKGSLLAASCQQFSQVLPTQVSVQVKEDELIGASLEKGNGFKVWYCTVSRSTLGRQIRWVLTSASHASERS